MSRVRNDGEQVYTKVVDPSPDLVKTDDKLRNMKVATDLVEITSHTDYLLREGNLDIHTTKDNKRRNITRQALNHIISIVAKKIFNFLRGKRVLD